jgi:cell division septal protein FtsQ
MPERFDPNSSDPNQGLYRDQLFTTADDLIEQPIIPGEGWRPRWLTLIALMMLLAAAAAIIVVLNSPLLEIRSVTVAGQQRVSPDAIAQLAALTGENILLADLEAARQRILAQPMVRDASVGREWPNTIHVRILEREPWVRWEVDGEVWAVDRDGVVLEGVEPPADSILMRQVSSLPAIRAGAHVGLDAVDLIQRVEEIGVPRKGPEIVAFEWSLRTGLTVVTRHGRVTFGDAEGFAFKYEVWEKLEREAQRRGEPLLTADLRFGTRPAVEIGLGLGRATRILDPQG